MASQQTWEERSGDPKDSGGYFVKSWREKECRRNAPGKFKGLERKKEKKPRTGIGKRSG